MSHMHVQQFVYLAAQIQNSSLFICIFIFAQGRKKVFFLAKHGRESRFLPAWYYYKVFDL